MLRSQIADGPLVPYIQISIKLSAPLKPSSCSSTNIQFSMGYNPRRLKTDSGEPAPHLTFMDNVLRFCHALSSGERICEELQAKIKCSLRTEDTYGADRDSLDSRDTMIQLEHRAIFRVSSFDRLLYNSQLWWPSLSS
jgi:hypothetical protein